MKFFRSRIWCAFGIASGISFIFVYFTLLDHPGVLIGGILLNLLAVALVATQLRRSMAKKAI